MPAHGADWLRLAVSFAVAAAGTPLLIAAGRRGFLIDTPNARSSHVQPRPRGGGLAAVVGFGVAAIPLFVADPARGLAIGGAVLAMALMGLADDLWRLPVLPRLLIQIAAASVVVWSVGALETIAIPGAGALPLGAFGFPAAVVWIVGVMNFYNFMDGIDGLAGGQAVLSCLLVAFAGWSAEATGFALALAGGVAGFLLFNWPPARIFMGDVGSMPIGFLLAILPLLARPVDRGPALYAAAVGLALFLLDPTVTLIRRIRRRHRVGESHRDHAYQQFVRPGASHSGATTALLGATALLVAAAVLAYRGGYGIVAGLFALAVFSVELVLAERRRQSAP